MQYEKKAELMWVCVDRNEKLQSFSRSYILLVKGEKKPHKLEIYEEGK